MTHKLYDLLGVSQNASNDEIKKAYKKQAMQHHPDKGGDETKFKEISNAYEILSDDNKRNQYNQLGDENYQNAQNGGGGGFPGGMNPHDLFAQMFGGMGGGGFPGMPGFHFNFHQQEQGPRKRGDHHHAIHLTLNEVYHGTRKNIQINLQKICLNCKSTCHMCQGRGQITNMVRSSLITQIIAQPCTNCNGSGSVLQGNPNCTECGGRSQYTEDKRVEINIEPGVHAGKELRFEGLGEQRLNNNELPGDLILQIQIHQDPLFTRENNNLKYIKQLTFRESILGTVFTINHFAGPLEINTKDFGIIQIAKKYEIIGKGMPIDGNKNNYGNLILQFDIIYPTKHLSTDDISILETALNAINL